MMLMNLRLQKARYLNSLLKCFHSTLSEHQKKVMAKGLPERKKLENVKKIICVASGKGGVGKSTVSCNIAVTLANHLNLKVGLLDADIYGPSIPKMMNLRGQPELNKRDLMIPSRNYNVNCMSMGFLVDEKAAIVWRGLMIMQAIERLVFKVDWGELDVLVIDMPPGTGDIQLSLSQNLIIDGAVCVTTPQEISLMDARKAIEMFRKVQVPILGIFQNMNSFKCTNCGHIEHIFGRNGAFSLAEESDSEIIGDIPIVSQITETSDHGQPISISYKDHHVTQIYIQTCKTIITKLNM